MKKIIVAESNSIIRNLIKKVLEIQNYHVTLVNNGKDIVKTLKKDDYDLILLDMALPPTDGIACTKRIRKITDVKKAQTPIFVLTGNAKNYNMNNFRDFGMNECILKPIDFDFLISKVRQYVDGND